MVLKLTYFVFKIKRDRN